MIRNILAVSAGVGSAILVITLVQSLGHVLYPTPDGLDTRNAQAMANFVSTLPVPALLFPLFAYFIGTFVGTAWSCRIGTMRPLGFAVIVGLFVLAGTIANLLLIPHPLWFSIFALIGIVVSAWLGMSIARGRPSRSEPKSGSERD